MTKQELIIEHQRREINRLLEAVLWAEGFVASTLKLPLVADRCLFDKEPERNKMTEVLNIFRDSESGHRLELRKMDIQDDD